jgi:hypothetical protein
MLIEQCGLCMRDMEPVIDAQLNQVNGWICWHCWPIEGSWIKAIGRERVIQELRGGTASAVGSAKSEAPAG